MLIRAAIISAIAVIVIVVSSPLFAVLGFEYSTIMGLALSFVGGISAAKKIDSLDGPWQPIRVVVWECMILASLPLLTSILSQLWLSNCSFGDGLIFYFEIAYPSAILGGLFGLACAWISKKASNAIPLFSVFWIVTLFLSFLPGYMNPQLFTYGWQYGFFPGLVWDESIELTNSYLAFRIESILWVIFALMLSWSFGRAKRTKWWFVIPGMIAIPLFLLNDALHITTSHKSVTSILTKVIRPFPDLTIFYAPNSLTQDEVQKIERDVHWYVHDIQMRFALKQRHEQIRVYIYPSTDAMFELIGTRTASISKPWLGEVHIAKENLESLKHELTHVLLREKGVFPFYASWSTGVTEGAAMSVEPEYDGIYTLDEHAARILQLHYGDGVKEVMSFTGFASNASQKSYVLAGSFSRYLLSTYGSAPFDRVYTTLDWKKEYGKPLDSLESEWKRWLAPLMTPMDANDSAHFKYYYDRSSIIVNPCLRRIGKLNREAARAYSNGQLQQAAELYATAVKEGAGISSLLWEAQTLGRLSNIAGSIAILDTTRTPIIRKQVAGLDLERASIRIALGDSIRANALLLDAMNIKLSAQEFLRAYFSEILLHSDVRDEWMANIKSLFTASSAQKGFIDTGYFNNMLLNHEKTRGFDPVDFSIRGIQFYRLSRLGNIALALRSNPFHSHLPQSQDISSNDSIAVSIVSLELAKLQSGNTLEYLAPIKYRRAAKEIANEINSEWQYLRSNPAEPVRETYP